MNDSETQISSLFNVNGNIATYRSLSLTIAAQRSRIGNNPLVQIRGPIYKGKCIETYHAYYGIWSHGHCRLVVRGRKLLMLYSSSCVKVTDDQESRVRIYYLLVLLKFSINFSTTQNLRPTTAVLLFGRLTYHVCTV